MFKVEKKGLIYSLIIFISLMLGTAMAANAQSRVLANYQRGIFLEAAGNSVGYSLNLEQTLANRVEAGLTARLGFGATSLDWYLPIGIQAVFLKGNHHLVISPTATARMKFITPFDFNDTDTFLHLQAGIGYRFQSRNSRIFGQLQFVPGFMLDPTSSQLSETRPEYQSRLGGALGIKI
ncbi:MAG: hypothetical protein MRZ79_20935 [Bacteroidia bacterium]|nr:hypothetical protein [Bacteroidia bacterium]